MPPSRTPNNQTSLIGPARSVLRGDLEEVGLSTLLTIMDMERRSGVLVLQRGRDLGRLHVRDGQVVRARIEGRRHQRGVDAVYELVGWDAGQFELWHASVNGPNEIATSTTFLLMEGMRRLDEERASNVIGRLADAGLGA